MAASNSVISSSDGSTFSSSAGQAGEAISAHSATHAALISGVACGTAVILCLLCALCWLGRHRILRWYCRVRTRMGMKALGSDKGTPTSTTSEWSVHRNASVTVKKGKGVSRSDSTNWTRHDLRKKSVANAGTTPHDVSSFGIGLQGLQEEGGRVKYTCLNPDPTSATMADEQVRAGSVPLWMQHPAGNLSAPVGVRVGARVPENPFLDRELPASPSVSSMPVPITPATATAVDSETATPTTATESTRSPTSPAWTTTPYQTRAQLPAHRPQAAQQAGRSRFQTPDQEEKQVYTPSLYQPYPPTSLTRAHPTYNFPPNTYSSVTTINPNTSNPYTHHPRSPRRSYSPGPHLPQPHSTVSLGSTAEIYRRLESCTDLYRGLSSQASPEKLQKAGQGNGKEDEGKKKERPPWDFLSAEDARGGGWRNSDGGVSWAETGWETVGDEGE